MVEQVTLPLYQQLLNEFAGDLALNQRQEPAFLVRARKQAFEYFEKLGFPTTRVEDWKYTNVIPHLKHPYSTEGIGLAGETLPENILEAATIENLDCYQVVLLNGRLLEPSAEHQLPGFIKIRRLAEATGEPAFHKYFGRNLNVEQYHFAALNSAMFRQGLLIEIEANTHLEKPLHIVHAYAAPDNLLVQPRHLLVVHRSASLSVIESVVSDNSEGNILVNSVTEVIVEGNARLNHYTLQMPRQGVQHVNHTEVCQKRDSVYSNYTFSLPAARLLRNNLNVNLDEEHTESHLYGLYLAADHQLIDNHTLMNHQMPNCESNEIYKGVLLDNATGVFNGKVYVHQDAQKTNAFQQNNNLLLSPKAVINSKPQLEIFADDVKCSHGSTIGQLSPEALFYLKSRGIGESTARALLVNAFAFDVTEKIKIPELEAYINKLINHHIPARQEMVKAE